MAIPTVYRSTDAGAPVIVAGTAGSGLDVIRKCLVDGYGSQAPAGWTEEFTGTNIAVFKNSTADGGSGCHVRVSDTSASTSNPPMEVRAYSSMSDVNTGSDATNVSYGSRCPNSGTVAWVLVATSTAFYFQAWGNTGTQHRCFIGAGDLVDFQPGDAYRYFVLGKGYGTTSTNIPAFGSGQSAWGVGYAGFSLPKGHTGIGAAIDAAVIAPAVTVGNIYVGGPAYPGLPAANSAAAAAMPTYVTDGAAADRIIRGRLPGIYIPLFNTTGNEAGAALPAAPLLPGSETILARFTSTSSGNPTGGVLIETALDWD